MAVSLFLYGLIVLPLLIAEVKDNRPAQYIFKPLAALGFIILALQFGALESTYGKFVFAGLVACAAGDVFLLARNSQKLFIVGMAAFALGHIFYSIGFIALGLEFDIMGREGNFVWGVAMMMIVLFALGGLHITKRADKSMKLPIIIYANIITMMCILAAFTNFGLAIASALLFAASDYFVGMDRFVRKQKYWALFITPLYFGAQALFALSPQALGAQI